MNRKNKDTFTRSDIEAALLKEFPEIGKNKIYEVLSIIFETITDSVALDEKVEIRGFGTFSKKYIRPRRFTNPKTKNISRAIELAKPSNKFRVALNILSSSSVETFLGVFIVILHVSRITSLSFLYSVRSSFDN